MEGVGRQCDHAASQQRLTGTDAPRIALVRFRVEKAKEHQEPLGSADSEQGANLALCFVIESSASVSPPAAPPSLFPARLFRVGLPLAKSGRSVVTLTEAFHA
jgi:hypothetical protein